jgi:hypothetical protein
METVYAALRSEILVNDVLLHATTLAVFLILLTGAAFIERRQTILSALLPLTSVLWAAAVVRFDFFIHRQGAYLSTVEHKLLAESGLPGWESWKNVLPGTRTLVPAADVIASLVMVAITANIAFGPCRRYFRDRGWSGGTIYAASSVGLTVALLSSLALIPFFTR